SQGVSSILYAKGKEIFDSGRLGDVFMIEAYSDRNTASGAWVYPIPPDANEQTIDWNAFLDGAPNRPFDPVRFFRWRCFADYGEGLARDRIRAGNEMDPRNQMNKEVARQALAIVRKATPSEEPDWIKGSVGRPIQIGVPVDRLFVCVWWDGVDPSAAGGVAVRIRLNHEHVTEPSRVKNILGFRVKDRTDPLAANLDDAISPLRRIDHGKSIFHRMGHR